MPILQGIKAVYVAELPPTNERIAEGRQHNEFWGDYPDIWDEPWGRVHRPFDSRAAMAPFVAHQLLKREGVDYKWLLYGDDDTMWFLSAVADLLRDYDSDLPYFISGMTAQHSTFGLCCRFCSKTALHAWVFNACAGLNLSCSTSAVSCKMMSKWLGAVSSHPKPHA